MTYHLCVGEYSHHRIRGEWCEVGWGGSIHGQVWYEFTYERKGDLFDGKFALTKAGKDDVAFFYEYDVRITIGVGGVITGHGESRYGTFVLRGDIGSSEWVKTYQVVHPVIRPPRGFSLGVLREQYQVARVLRLVFRDRLWRLEFDVRSGRMNSFDVLEYLRETNEPAELIEEYERKLFVRRHRRQVELTRRLTYVRSFRHTLERVRRLQGEIKRECVRRKTITNVIGSQWKHELGKTVTVDQLNQVLLSHTKPLFGVRFDPHSGRVDPRETVWGEISDELYFELRGEVRHNNS